MAADAVTNEPLAVTETVSRLQALLEKVKTVKTSTSVEPALSPAHVGQDISAICDDVFETVPKPQRQTVLETAVRKVFYGHVQSDDIYGPAFVDVWNLLDILLIFCEVEKPKPEPDFQYTLVWLFIEELVESQTTDRCRAIFDYLESRRERLIQRDFAKVHPYILRTCNELLKRLSRAEDPAFCGRVFFFLFRVSPLGDHSSANLRGEYHVDNVTTYEKDLEPLPVEDGAEAMQIDNVEAEKSLSSTADGDAASFSQSAEHKQNSELYSSFWRLQQDFSMPTRLFEDENFEVFKAGLSSTMTKFERTATVVQTKIADEEPRGVKRKLGEEAKSHYHSTYNPKYLTSRELFELELSDLAFQRHILVQALIIIDFMLSLTEAAKKNLNLESVTRTNRSVIYTYALSDAKQEWLVGMRKSIRDYLSKGDQAYFRMVETVLARDRNWVRWKIEYCPPIFKEAVSVELYAEAKSSARKTIAPRRLKDTPPGAIDLTFLHEADKARGLDSLRDPARFTELSVNELIKGMETDELDMEMATENERDVLQRQKDNKYWRAMRIATRTGLGKLTKLEPGKNTFKEIWLSDEAPAEAVETRQASVTNEKSSDEPGTETDNMPAEVNGA